MSDRRPDDSWDRILAEVREQKTADLTRLADTPLEFGAPIVWKRYRWEKEHFTPVHRVGYTLHGRAYTACDEQIPAPLLWLPLSPAMIRSMKECPFCNAEIGRIARSKIA